MKKNLLLAAAIICSTFLFTSCKKEKMDEIKNVTLNVTINAGELYKLDLGQYGDADDAATITTQANTFTTSEVVKSGIIGEYNFMKAGVPKTGGNGNETVVLKITEGQRGGNGITVGGCMGNSDNGNHHNKKHHEEEINVTINFTIL